jgi:hypothetical protein
MGILREMKYVVRTKLFLKYFNVGFWENMWLKSFRIVNTVLNLES